MDHDARGRRGAEGTGGVRRLAPALALALALPLLGAPATAQEAAAPAATTPATAQGPYDPAADATAALDAALAAAQARAASGSQQRVLAIFGANWCHDSRDLATMLERPRVAELVAQHYQVVLIDAGVPQTGNGRNLDLAARHGVDGFTGTPTMLVLDPQGRLVNTPEDARAWRNASTRGERAVRRYLREMAKPQR